MTNTQTGNAPYRSSRESSLIVNAEELGQSYARRYLVKFRQVFFSV